MEEKKELKTVKKDISVQVLQKVELFKDAGELSIPKDYNVENALKSAYIILSDPKNNLLQKCDVSSVSEALLKMVIFGVSPVKNQCYFIPYGNKLELSISYAGNVLIAKRFGGLKTIKGNAIFKGDKFSFEVDPDTGLKRIIEHTQTLESIGSGIVVGAYAVTEMTDGTRDLEVMNISQIRASWEQGGSKGASPAHKKFPDQMAIKTVMNRACKMLIRSSNDSIFLDDENSPKIDAAKEDVKQEVEDNANIEVLDFEEIKDVEEKKEIPKASPADAFDIATS